MFLLSWVPKGLVAQTLDLMLLEATHGSGGMSCSGRVEFIRFRRRNRPRYKLARFSVLFCSLAEANSPSRGSLRAMRPSIRLHIVRSGDTAPIARLRAPVASTRKVSWRLSRRT
jgi:hypothetical protein